MATLLMNDNSVKGTGLPAHNSRLHGPPLPAAPRGGGGGPEAAQTLGDPAGTERGPGWPG